MNHSLFCMPGYYLIEESSPTSAGNLDWVRGILFGKDKPSYGEIDNMVASVAPESSSLLFFPFLYGSNARNRKHAAWVGLHSGHGTEHLLRAVYEGVAFSHKQHVERLLKYRKTPPYIRIAGGAANSDVWMQLFADVLETPLQVVDGKELGAMALRSLLPFAAAHIRIIIRLPEKWFIFGRPFLRTRIRFLSTEKNMLCIRKCWNAEARFCTKYKKAVLFGFSKIISN